MPKNNVLLTENSQIGESGYELMALDLGNAQIKPKSRHSEACIAHAIRQLTPSEIENYRERGELDTNPAIWKVNKTYYFIGDRALRNGAGAVLYGEARYVPEYYGTWAAIAAFLVIPYDAHNIYLYGGHTTKDIGYRKDLINAVKGRSFTVSHGGESRSFTFAEVKGFEETVMVYRYATMADQGQAQSGWLLKGDCITLDIGGFTIGVTVAKDGQIEYSEGDSARFGMLDVLDEFANLIRAKYKAKIKGMNKLDMNSVRDAFRDPSKGYDARGFGMLPCFDEAQKAIGVFERELDGIFQQFGGIGRFHNVCIGGGGTGAMEEQVRRVLGHPKVYLAEKNLDEIHFCAVRGAFIILSLMERKGKL